MWKEELTPKLLNSILTKHLFHIELLMQIEANKKRGKLLVNKLLQ